MDLQNFKGRCCVRRDLSQYDRCDMGVIDIIFEVGRQEKVYYFCWILFFIYDYYMVIVLGGDMKQKLKQRQFGDEFEVEYENEKSIEMVKIQIKQLGIFFQ